MGREAMQPVELTESTGPDATSPDAAGSGERAEADARRRWSRRRRWALAVAAALVVGLVSTQAVLDARERAHLAHLATIPGVLAPVDASVGTLWSTNDESKIALLSGAPAGDLRISGYIDPAGERAVQAIRARTGERAWSTVLRAADPAAPAQGTALGPSCSLTGPAEAPGKVVCLVTDAAYVTDDTGARTPVAPTYARVVVLDPLTGTLQGQRDAPTSAQLGALDGLAVVAWRTDDGHLVVTGTEPVTGDVRWRFESPRALADAVADDAARYGTSGLRLMVVADHVAVGASGGELWIFSRTGDLVHDAMTPAGRAWVQEPRPGLLAIVEFLDQSPSTTFLGPDGSPGPTLATQFPSFPVDDGSVPNLVFSLDGVLTAWDATTGVLVWTSSFQVSSTGVLLEGRLYAETSGGRLLALDAATGATLWEQPLAVSSFSSLFTDGRSILALETVSAGRLSLVAFAPEDGHRRWASPLPLGVDYAWDWGGQLVGMSADGSFAVALG